MSWNDHFFGGLAGTAVLTTTLSAGRGLGLTRIDIPFMLGTILTKNRDIAQWSGFCIHFINGWLFTFGYFAIFDRFQINPLIVGPIVGIFHSLFILTVGMNILPSFHPRMATEHDGPTPTKMLEPPGFMALHYGRGTPIITIISHVIFGLVLGLFFRH